VKKTQRRLNERRTCGYIQRYTPSRLKEADRHVMSTEVAESGVDLDLGSGGEMLLPDLTDSNGDVKHPPLRDILDGERFLLPSPFSPSR